MSIVVENAVISYPALFEAKPNPSGAFKYSCSLLIDKNDKKMVKRLEEAVAKCIEIGKGSKWGGKVPHFQYEPIRDGDKELESGQKTDKIYKNKVFINLSSDTPPGIVGPNNQRLMDQTALFAGCIVHVQANPFPYKNGGNCGIGWGLNNVMLVDNENVERLDGRQSAEDAFGNYANEEGDE